MYISVFMNSSTRSIILPGPSLACSKRFIFDHSFTRSGLVGTSVENLLADRTWVYKPHQVGRFPYVMSKTNVATSSINEA